MVHFNCASEIPLVHNRATSEHRISLPAAELQDHMLGNARPDEVAAAVRRKSCGVQPRSRGLTTISNPQGSLMADNREFLQCGHRHVKPTFGNGCEICRDGELPPHMGSTEFLDLYFALYERGNMFDLATARIHAQ